MKLFKYLSLIPLLSLASIHSEASENMIDKMETAEKAYNNRLKQTRVAFMSIETMFPDENVRALAIAAADGDVDKIDEIVKGGVDVNSKGTSNAIPLYWAMHNIKGFEKLLQLGADPNFKFGLGSNIMYWAVAKNDVEQLKLAIKYGGNPSVISGSMKRPLILDAFSKDEAIMDTLLTAGADVNSKTQFGMTMLMMAAARGQYNIVYKLLLHGADYNYVNKKGVGLLKYINKTRTRELKGKFLDDFIKVEKWLIEKGYIDSEE